ncbi:aminodeoxychorismate synthase component I [Thalassobacillus sp. C254]|uniref:aminodeoxychorismate synthase component I n=1 Tax=Thalassobacillus sp. C254 TaxID=1225341 RepID=UPI0006CF4801
MNEAFSPLPAKESRRYVKAQSFSFPEEKWFHTYKHMSKNLEYHVLLESGRSGRYSMAGLSPFALLRGKDDLFTVETKEGKAETKGDILEEMRRWLAPYQTKKHPELPDFQGGAIGFFSYDLVRQVELLPQDSSDDLNTDDFYFLVFNDVFLYDHQEKKLWIIVHYQESEQQKAEAKIADYYASWSDPYPSWEWSNKEEQEEMWEVSLNEGEFSQAVRKVQDYIKAGDVFQVNLSVRQAKTLQTEPLHIYEKLRELNPSPYMAYIHTPDFQLVSGSPELLVKKDGEEASTRPIAGTRSRGKTKEQDLALEEELLYNEKERAEHVMLVDLERNDLGRVCKYGSVYVDELMVIERYSHVMHIVSNVKGILAEDIDVYDMIRATFPGGTITGAPKIRTMEIIEELEPVRRGVYTGSIGWIGFNGDMEMNIVIRTLLAKEGKAYVQAGAGIVIDSNPAAEYKESLKKAKALWKAKELSEEEVSGKQSRAEEEHL